MSDVPSAQAGASLPAAAGSGKSGYLAAVRCGYSAVEWCARWNETAADLRDHWNHTGSFRSYRVLRNGHHIEAFSLRRGGYDRSFGIHSWSRNRWRGYLGGGRGRGAGSFSLFEDVRDVAWYDGDGGFQYAFGRGGPAGSLDIDLDWSNAPFVGEAERATVERATKLWAWRLADVIGQRDMSSVSTTMSVGDRSYSFGHEAGPLRDGMDILMMPSWNQWPGLKQGVIGFARPHTGWDWDGAFRAATGLVWLSDQVLSREGDFFGNRAKLVSLMAHEVGHVLGNSRGIGGYARYLRPYFSQVGGLDFGTGFHGPNAMRVNFGFPVAMQSDMSHAASCFSIMGYCHELGSEKRVNVFGPTELDLAMLADLGYEVLPAFDVRDPESYTWAAWGGHAVWGVKVERVLRWEYGWDLRARDHLTALADHEGREPAAGLGVGSPPILSGRLSWEGPLFGVDVSDAAFPPVTGRAALGLTLPETPDGTVSDARLDLSSLEVSDDGTSRRFGPAGGLRYSLHVFPEWNAFWLPLTDSGFVEGNFYGPEHEEMAGTVHDPSVGLFAAFGGSRLDGDAIGEERPWALPLLFVEGPSSPIAFGVEGVEPGRYGLRELLQEPAYEREPIEGRVLLSGTSDLDYRVLGYWVTLPVGVREVGAPDSLSHVFHYGPGFGDPRPLSGRYSWKGDVSVMVRHEVHDDFGVRVQGNRSDDRELALSVDVGIGWVDGRVPGAVEDYSDVWDLLFEPVAGGFARALSGEIHGGARLVPATRGTDAFERTSGRFDVEAGTAADVVGFQAEGWSRVQEGLHGVEYRDRYSVVGIHLSEPKAGPE